MRLSKKKLAAIGRASFVIQALNEVWPGSGEKWWDSAPEWWTQDQKEIWDLLHETEDKLREEIVKIVEGKA